MPWVRFLQDWSWVPPPMPMTAIAYRRGMVLFVTTPCAAAAVRAGKAEPAQRPLERDNAGR